MVIRPMLPAFAAAHSDATVEVLIEYGFRDIIADQFDAGIRLGEKIEQDMIALKVGPDLRMAVVAAPSYLARHGTPRHPRDLVDHRCINYRMVASGAIYAWEFEENGVEFEARVPGPLTFNEPQLMLDAAIEGLGIAYLLESDVSTPREVGRAGQPAGRVDGAVPRLLSLLSVAPADAAGVRGVPGYAASAGGTSPPGVIEPCTA
jgi:DNA-binding transcriptional LysR family regulator